jgi:hypothetical protein
MGCAASRACATSAAGSLTEAKAVSAWGIKNSPDWRILRQFGYCFKRSKDCWLPALTPITKQTKVRNPYFM